MWIRNKYTICIPVELNSSGQINRILLGLKKAGTSSMIGKYNGFGGHIEFGEDPCQSMVRELREESKLTATSWEKVGLIKWFVPALADWNPGSCSVYLVREFEGEPKETYEMRPEWFKLDEIPYRDMWADTRIWLPAIIEGLKFKGDFSYSKENINLLTKVDFKIVGGFSVKF